MAALVGVLAESLREARMKIKQLTKNDGRKTSD